MNQNPFPLGVAVWAWRGAITLSTRPSILWLPLLLVTAIQVALLLLLPSFHHGALIFLGLPLIRLLGGENATHYPLLYYALPTMLEMAPS